MRAIAIAVLALALPACGGDRAPEPGNDAATTRQDRESPTDPARPSDPAGPLPSNLTIDRETDPAHVPPPDAVSHPDGYLPPAPAEPGSKGPAPATEDEYLNNRQSGR